MRLTYITRLWEQQKSGLVKYVVNRFRRLDRGTGTARTNVVSLLTGKESWIRLGKLNRGIVVERRILKRIGARRQPASGSLPGMPNDGVKGRYLIEVKSTVGASISVQRRWLKDLDENAMMRGKIGAMILVFEELLYASESHVKTRSTEHWVAVPLEEFERLSEKWKR